MKPILTSLILFLLLTVSCTKDDDTTTPGPISGTWRIHYYWDEKDETSDFTGYTFEFLNNGQVKATKAGTTVTGTWSETSSDFNLDFGTDPVLQEINDDWQKIERTSTFIKLKDDNPAQDDELHFVKM